MLWPQQNVATLPGHISCIIISQDLMLSINNYLSINLLYTWNNKLCTELGIFLKFEVACVGYLVNSTTDSYW